MNDSHQAIEDRSEQSLEIGPVDKVYALSEAGNAVAHILGHHARGKVAIAV